MKREFLKGPGRERGGRERRQRRNAGLYSIYLAHSLANWLG
jgi:hypothetical protein